MLFERGHKAKRIAKAYPASTRYTPHPAQPYLHVLAACLTRVQPLLLMPLPPAVHFRPIQSLVNPVYLCSHVQPAVAPTQPHPGPNNPIPQSHTLPHRCVRTPLTPRLPACPCAFLQHPHTPPNPHSAPHPPMPTCMSVSPSRSSPTTASGSPVPMAAAASRVAPPAEPSESDTCLLPPPAEEACRRPPEGTQ